MVVIKLINLITTISVIKISFSCYKMSYFSVFPDFLAKLVANFDSETGGSRFRSISSHLFNNKLPLLKTN